MGSANRIYRKTEADAYMDQLEADLKAVTEERDRLKSCLADSFDHSDMDAVVFQLNALQSTLSSEREAHANKTELLRSIWSDPKTRVDVSLALSLADLFHPEAAR